MKIFTEKEVSYLKKTENVTIITNALNLIALLIVTLIPGSDFANSFDRDGMDAVYVLLVASLISVAAAALYSAKTYLTIKKDNGTLITKLFTGYNFLMLAFAFRANIVFTIYCWRLGFVSSVYDTSYELVQKVYLIISLIGILLTLLVVILNKKANKK